MTTSKFHWLSNSALIVCATQFTILLRHLRKLLCQLPNVLMHTQFSLEDLFSSSSLLFFALEFIIPSWYYLPSLALLHSDLLRIGMSLVCRLVPTNLQIFWFKIPSSVAQEASLLSWFGNVTTENVCGQPQLLRG